MEFLRIQNPPERTNETRTRATQMLTNTIVEMFDAVASSNSNTPKLQKPVDFILLMPLAYLRIYRGFGNQS